MIALRVGRPLQEDPGLGSAIGDEDEPSAPEASEVADLGLPTPTDSPQLLPQDHGLGGISCQDLAVAFDAPAEPQAFPPLPLGLPSVKSEMSE